MKEFILPADVLTILNTLETNGFQGFVVGGCVRDHLMGNVPKDYDITTDALPQQVEAIFSDYKVVETGIQHGTVTLVINRIPYEITTFRNETEYDDHRHPNHVSFSKQLKEDLRRRDFTINAMAYNPVDGLIDLFGGQKDLSDGIIRAIGNPEERFNEDALRIMRCLRFASRYGFEIDLETEKALFKMKDLLDYISVERILSEFNEIICTSNIDHILDRYLEIIIRFIPELLTLKNNGIWNDTIRITASAASDTVIRWAALLHAIDKANEESSVRTADTILRRLKMDNHNRNSILKLIRYQDYPLTDSLSQLKKICSLIGYDLAEKLINLQKAINSVRENGISEEKYENLFKQLEEIRNEPVTVNDLVINGNDVMALGYTGKEVGDALRRALDAIIEGEISNERESIIDYLKKSA